MYLISINDVPLKSDQLKKINFTKNKTPIGMAKIKNKKREIASATSLYYKENIYFFILLVNAKHCRHFGKYFHSSL